MTKALPAGGSAREAPRGGREAQSKVAVSARSERLADARGDRRRGAQAAPCRCWGRSATQIAFSCTL